MIELWEAFDDLNSLIESGARPPMQLKRDEAIAGSLRRLQKLVRGRLRKQRHGVIAGTGLRRFSLYEADTNSRKKTREQIAAEVLAALGPEVHGVPVTAEEETIFAGAIRQAVDAGAAGVADLMRTGRAGTGSFITEYLQDGGFTRLTGQIDKTTVDRLAATIADAYAAGEDFDGTVAAVKREFADMTTYRAKMISQTELNDAYNQSILHFGREAGAETKTWETDAMPCAICTVNAMSGPIDFDSDFPSGDDAPPAHPNCLCSLLVGAKN